MKRLGLLMGMVWMALLVHNSVFAVSADDVLGEWYTEGSKSIVTVYKDGDTYAGKITWLKDPKNDDGTDKKDTNNPDKTLQTRTLIGLELVWGFTFDGKKWTDGNIYDPESGKTYYCTMKMDGSSLDVRGSLGSAGLLGRTTTWTKVE